MDATKFKPTKNYAGNKTKLEERQVKAHTDRMKRTPSGRNSKITVQKNGCKLEIPCEYPLDKSRELIRILSGNDSDLTNIGVTREREITGHRKDKSKVTSEILVLFVPAIIALLFAGTLAYLVIANQDHAEYIPPESLRNAISIIIGYYFGVGASTLLPKTKTLSEDEVKQFLDRIKEAKTP